MYYEPADPLGMSEEWYQEWGAVGDGKVSILTDEFKEECRSVRASTNGLVWLEHLRRWGPREQRLPLTEEQSRRAEEDPISWEEFLAIVEP